MKAGLVICGPDVAYGPLALLSGSFEEKAARAAELGYDGIELMVRDPGHLDWPAVKSTLDNAGLEVPQIVTGELYGADGLCLVTADEDIYRRAEERTRAVIDLAAYLGAMVNIGRLRGQLKFLGDVSDPWPIALERLRGVIDYAARQGVKITMEPINRYETDFILSAADGMRLVEDLGCDNLGLMLDLFHMNIEDVSIEEGLRQAGERLWHVHIADSNRRYPGCGHLDFDRIFATLRDMNYEGYISAEMLPLPDPDTAARKTIEFLTVRLGAFQNGGEPASE
ncbi:MAG: 5-keto-L-gluconate epimerase [Anaerolineae bacterium]